MGEQKADADEQDGEQVEHGAGVRQVEDVVYLHVDFRGVDRQDQRVVEYGDDQGDQDADG